MFIHILQWLTLFLWDNYHIKRSRHRAGIVRWDALTPIVQSEPEVRVPAGYTLTVDHQGERLLARRSPLPEWAGSYRLHPYDANNYGDILV